MTVRPPLSVVVPTRDRPAHLDACLTALRADVRPDDELLVVDSHSVGPGTASVARRHGVPVVTASRPGASLARNLGWRAARHDLVAFVDDDIRIRPGWADAIVTAAVARPTVGFVTGSTHLPPSQAQLDHGVALKTDAEPVAIDATTDGTLGGSCNLLLRRAALEAVGGFDEALGPGTWFAAAEDLDLYDRLLAAGVVGWYAPAAAVDHVQWRSRRQRLGLDWAYGKGMGARLVRLRRLDRGRARTAAREALWAHGLRACWQDLRAGYQFGAVAAATRTVATIVGAGVAVARGVAR